MKTFEEGQFAWAVNMGLDKVKVNKVTTNENNDIEYLVTSVATGGSYVSNNSLLFEYKINAQDYIKEKREEKRNKYREEIKTKKDLLEFMMREPLTGSYANVEALTVVKEKALDFFGITL